MSKSILLVGGAGFLGTALAAQLRRQTKRRVVTASRTKSLSRDSLQLDLLKDDVAARTAQFTTIVNLTGQMTEPISPCLELNSLGIQNLIDSCQANHQRLIQISTTLVYGSARAVSETSPLAPQSAYATAKTVAELLIRHQLPPRQFLTVRLSNLYGPGQTKGMIWYLINCLTHQRPIIITDNDGTLARHYLDVRDAAHILTDLITRWVGGVVNVAGPDRYSIRQLVDECETLLDKRLSAHYAQITPPSNIDIIKTTRLKQLVPVRWSYSVRKFLTEALL